MNRTVENLFASLIYQPAACCSNLRLSPEEAMEEAWRPRAKDVSLLMEEAEASRAEAVAVLKKHRGEVAAGRAFEHRRKATGVKSEVV